MELVVNENKRVLTVKFTNDFFNRTQYKRGLSDVPGEHEAAAKYIWENHKVKLYSAIIFCQRMRDELYDDPLHCEKTSDLWRSRMEVEAIEDTKYDEWQKDIDEYLKSDDISLIEKWDEPDDSKANLEFKMSVKDKCYENIVILKYPILIYQLKESCKYKLDECGYHEEDDKGEAIPVDEKTAAEQYRREVINYIFPRTGTSLKRKYLMPRPFSHWDSRNGFQQFFFIEDLEGNIEVHIGGSGGSASRHSQGYYAHIFATLEDMYDIEIPTTIMHYNKDNELLLYDEVDRFVAVDRELTGNYQGGKWDQLDKVFKNRLIGFREDYEKGKMVITKKY